MVGAKLSFLLSHLSSQLITLRDIAPVIGAIVLIAIAVAIIFAIYKLIIYLSKQAARDYILEHPESTPPPPEA